MVAEHRARRELEEALMAAIGSGSTDTSFRLPASAGWADVATQRDLRVLGSDLRAEMSELRAEMHREMAALRVDVGQQLQSMFYRILMLQVAVLAIVVALVGTDLLH